MKRLHLQSVQPTRQWLVFAILLTCTLWMSGCRQVQHEKGRVPNWNEHSNFASATVDRWQVTPLHGHPAFKENWSKPVTLTAHLRKTLEHLQPRTGMPSSQWEPAIDKTSTIALITKLERMSTKSPDAFWAAMDEEFVLLSPESSLEHPAFFTGYYSPIYKGSRQKTTIYRFPIYAAPEDLTSQRQKYSRTAIEKNEILRGRKLELCYLDSPLDVFLLQVQGSGTVELKDGSILEVGFAGHNGRSYTSLGQRLIEENLVKAEDISLEAIRQQFRRHPEVVRELMGQNERYIFFRESDGSPRGSTGVEVAAFHSLATERDESGQYRFPAHLPVLVSLQHPIHASGRHMIALCQDTGSAIKGDLRADIYLGRGLGAEQMAGSLKHRGDFHILWPKSWALPKSIAGKRVQPDSP